jgi:hypothetical protein
MKARTFSFPGLEGRTLTNEWSVPLVQSESAVASLLCFTALRVALLHA